MDGTYVFTIVLLLISFAVRDLFFNVELTTERRTERHKGDHIDLGNGQGSSRNSKDDDFFDEDDQYDDFKSSLHQGTDGNKLGPTPGSRISSAKFTGPTVRFLYCSTSGYKNAYDQFVAVIQEKRPELFVEGATFPPSNYKRIAAQISSIIKFLVIGSVLVSQYSFLRLVGVPVGLTNWMSQNKVYACLVCFFLCNFIESQLVSTGAFEIYYDDVPIWSKLQTGRVPSPPELMQIIDNQLKMGGRESIMEGFKL